MPGPKLSPCPKCKRRPRRRPGQWCTPCDKARNDAYRARQRAAAKKKKAEAEKMPRFTRALEAKRYLITSAQNATPIEPLFFAALERAAKHLRAELVVIPFRYKNPTSVFPTGDQRSQWWGVSPEEERRGVKNPLRPYLFNTRKKLCEHLVLAADIKMQPTAVSPLTGFEALTGGESCIIGHPKMQFKVVPAPSGRMPKILSTTGACTRKNYTDTKAGKLGAFHHFLGAVLVEIEGKRFHLRQLNADRETGAFIDLDREYTPRSVRKAPRALGLVLGDWHARFTCPKVDAATFGPGGIVETLNPRELVWHDTFDGYAINHHHAGDPFLAAAKSAAKLGDPEAEVRHAVQSVVERTKGRRSVIVASNHDDFLARWIKATDWRTTGAKRFYLETAIAMLERAIKSGMTGEGFRGADPFVYWANRLKGKAPIKCLSADESHKIGGVEVGSHGHNGPNGVPGTMKNMARVGARMTTGHRHAPGIEEGHYGVGTSSPLRLEYVRGPGSWLNTHSPIYANGKRALITIVDGSWHLARR
jgi:hypothetical protein